MSQIIANSYEIVRKIGSGGGGVVYLAKHLRLGKWVVLKADKRTLSAKPETLRREVDALKNLSHSYIPQVYDFVVEGDTVYTVMDYIEGESLDQPLKRGERFPQAQVIQWAFQLLEALRYLHSRPPHGILHSDIKPANIMRTPDNEIRLIDFNIALALGEEGAVRVGFSRGYASPEHYGIDYTAAAVTQQDTPAASRLSAETVLPGQGSSSASLTKSRSLLLDVRSDIYSLGATLYHLLSGQRPAQDAKEVAPLPPSLVSPAVAAILQKAMAPDPNRRYQSAQEMLDAFARLHRDDPRAKRHRRRAALTAAALSLLFLAGGLCTFTGLRQMERAEQAARREAEAAEEAERTAKQALAALTASTEARRAGDIPKALSEALAALALDSPYAVEAQKALTDALGVYDLSEHFADHKRVSLPSEPLKIALSPGGTRAAAVVSGAVRVFDAHTGQLLAELPADPSALSDAVFLGEDTLLYAGAGALRCHSLAENRELWRGKPATGITLSADGSTAAAVYKDENLAAVYDARSGEALRAVSFEGRHQSAAANDVFADPNDSLFALSGDGRWLAVSFSDGGLRVFSLHGGEDLYLFDASGYTRFEGGFFGPYLAFSASKTGESVFAVVNVETGEQTGGFASANPFHVYADEAGICVSSENLAVALDPLTGEQRELAYAEADIASFLRREGYTAAVLTNGSLVFYDEAGELVEKREGPYDFIALSAETAAAASRDAPELRLLRLSQREPELVYDRTYPHSEARVSADGSQAMLFRYDRFRIVRADGTTLAETLLPDGEQVYDQQYRRDGAGDYLEVFYNDGTVRSYSAADGRPLSERAGEPPDGTLDEEFLTSTLRITAPLHGTPAAYDRESGALVRELEKDAYLSYVTEVGEYLVTDYVTAQGERYGVLLNGRCEPLAELPNLCDVTADGRLVFDDMRGNLRYSRIYSLQELKALAETILSEEGTP